MYSVLISLTALPNCHNEEFLGATRLESGNPLARLGAKAYLDQLGLPRFYCIDELFRYAICHNVNTLSNADMLHLCPVRHLALRAECHCVQL